MIPPRDHSRFTPPYVPPERKLKTIYDLLRRLVEGGAWSDIEHREASELVDRLEAASVLGNVANEIVIKSDNGRE